MGSLRHILFSSDDSIRMPTWCRQIESDDFCREAMITCLAMKPRCLFEGGPSSEACASMAGLLSSRSAI